MQHENTLNQQALAGMKQLKELRLIGFPDQNTTVQSDRIGVLMFDIKNKAAGSIARKLALNQAVGLRYGCHCAHLMVKQLTGFTPFQEKLQKNIKALFPKLTLQGFARISFGIENTSEEVDRLISGLKAMTSGKNPPNEFTKQQVKQQLSVEYNKRKTVVFSI
jgi:selenocysteine lyase/cysteine desulfurase